MRATVLATLLLSLASLARADVSPPVRRMLVVADVHAVDRDSDAPREERGRAASDVRRGLEGFLSRIGRCVRDHGRFSDGRVRARIEFDRSALPTRSRIVDGRGAPALRACVAEVLPSIALREPPHGRITIDASVAAIDGW
jgi:hypothetical protein